MSRSLFLQRLVACGASASLMAFASTALAQEPPPAAAAAPPPPGVAPAPGAPIEEPGARFRWGISALGGPMLGGLSGAAGGFDVRLGAQINNMIGAYAQPVFIVGLGGSSSAHGVSASAFAAYGLGALADFTFGDLFFVGVGPELLFGEFATATVTSAAGASAAAGNIAFFSVVSRIGLALGSMKPERRKAFTIGLSPRVILTSSSPVILATVALGYDSF